jgi:thymidine phosphorylase
VVGVFIGVGVGVLVQTGRTLDRVESVTNPKARAAQEQAVKDLVAAAVCQVSKELHLHDPMVLLPAGCVP